MTASYTRIVLSVILLGFAFSAPCQAQEDLLERATGDHNRRLEGLVKLQERLQKMSWLGDAKKIVEFLESKKEERKVDPFGMPMDPDDVPEELLTIQSEDGAEATAGPTAAETLAAALSKINVTGVFPSRGEIIVGARSLRRGSTIVVSQGQTNFQLQITNVTQDAVHFRDLNSGESAKADLDIIPGGSFEGISRRPAPADASSGTIVPRTADVYRVEADDSSMATTASPE